MLGLSPEIRTRGA